MNNNLNKYSFLITITHEIAHMMIWEKHQNKVDPHGEEWKMPATIENPKVFEEIIEVIKKLNLR